MADLAIKSMALYKLDFTHLVTQEYFLVQCCYPTYNNINKNVYDMH